MRHERERDPDAFRCPGCEIPTRGGRFCQACLDERRAQDCKECGGTPRTDHKLWCSGRRQTDARLIALRDAVTTPKEG